MFDADARAGLALARQLGWLMAAELRAHGVDISFAPCVDLDLGVSEVIGDRAFHSQPEAVAQLAVAYVHGMRAAGMAATAKHLAAGCDMLPVCNNRASVTELLDHLDARVQPASSLRLVRMRGRAAPVREELLASAEWASARAALAQIAAAPSLTLVAGRNP